MFYSTSVSKGIMLLEFYRRAFNRFTVYIKQAGFNNRKFVSAAGLIVAAKGGTGGIVINGNSEVRYSRCSAADLELKIKPLLRRELKEQNFQQNNKYNSRHAEFISASPGKIFPCTPRDPETSSG